MESAVTDLPEPDSPTSASVSPGAMSKETWSTAGMLAPPPNATERSWTERSGEAVIGGGRIDGATGDPWPNAPPAPPRMLANGN